MLLFAESTLFGINCTFFSLVTICVLLAAATACGGKKKESGSRSSSKPPNNVAQPKSSIAAPQSPPLQERTTQTYDSRRGLDVSVTKKSLDVTQDASMLSSKKKQQGSAKKETEKTKPVDAKESDNRTNEPPKEGAVQAKEDDKKEPAKADGSADDEKKNDGPENPEPEPSQQVLNPSKAADLGNLDDKIRPHGEERKKAIEKLINEMASDHELSRRKPQPPAKKNIAIVAEKCKVYETHEEMGTISERRTVLND
ncbi:hypothetical protein AAVH_02362 [Aphelenchoides avenae]|nr:hypothetical protein AAVH_02362 [Aphelenchus avenae]